MMPAPRTGQPHHSVRELNRVRTGEMSVGGIVFASSMNHWVKPKRETLKECYRLPAESLRRTRIVREFSIVNDSQLCELRGESAMTGNLEERR